MVGIKRKSVLLKEAEELFKNGKKLENNKIYDGIVTTLFRDMLHKADKNEIVFAHRGSKNRKISLENAIIRARTNFENKRGVYYRKPISVHSGFPHEYAGLQVVDYYLWAIQRLYEKQEDRFFLMLEKDYKLIMDFDDRRRNDYGEWYKEGNSLRIEKLPK